MSDQPKPTTVSQERAEQAALRGRADNISVSERSKRDQPKPTGVTRKAMKEVLTGMHEALTKPTGEWTADYVWNLRNNELEADHAIADAHNAALAAETRKYSDITHKWEQCVIEIQQLREQLATEKKKFDALASTQFDLERLAMDKQEQIKELKSQLAAIAKVKEGK